MVAPQPGVGSESTTGALKARWCPRCQGVKRPSDTICLACAITLKAQRQRTLASLSTPDLRTMLAGFTQTETVRRGGHDYTYDDLMKEMANR